MRRAVSLILCVFLSSPLYALSDVSVAFSVPDYYPSLEERQLVAACLVLEAASQGTAGMRGVMSVVRNRARGQSVLFAPTVVKAKQFSAFNRHTAGRETREQLILRAQRDRTWSAALWIVDEACGNRWQDTTKGATHYTRVGERTRWTRTLVKTVIIGQHAFYR